MATIEQIILTAMMSVGLLAGLVAYRDSYVQELGDVAVALDHLDQTYTYTINGVTSSYTDTVTLADPVGLPPAGISVTAAASEGE